MMEILWIGAAVAALIAWQWWRSRRTPEQVDLMRSVVREGGALIDVRTSGEFEAGHVDAAVNIPLATLHDRLRDIGPPERSVVLCCQSGARSRVAAGILRRAGFQQVLDLGPHRNWHRHSAER